MITYRLPLFTLNGRTAAAVIQFDPEAAAAALAGFRDRLADATPYWEEVGTLLRQDAREKFAVGGKPRWQPLSERTIAEKRRLINRGSIPPRTPTGKIPRRLLQNGEFSEGTLLIRTGRLRDSWVVKGARGHVEEVRNGEFFFGSQLTIQRELKPEAEEKEYHLLTKKARRERARGNSVAVQIPLARFHEEGTKTMPARPVMVGPDGEALIETPTLTALERAALRWATGEEHT